VCVDLNRYGIGVAGGTENVPVAKDFIGASSEIFIVTNC